MRLIAFGLAAALALAGCSSGPPLVATESLTVLNDSSALPAPQRTDLVAADRPSLIGPLDTISIDVFGLAELSRDMQVDASGRVAMPLIGTIDARGKTAEELGKSVEGALREHFVRDPHVTVNIRNSVSQVVTVDGEVTQPGLYPVTNQMTLERAIAQAKGFSEYAKGNEVVVLRTVNGKRMAGLYNVTAIRRGLYADPPIYANDVVIVGNSPARRIFKDFVSLSPLLASPLVAILR